MGIRKWLTDYERKKKNRKNILGGKNRQSRTNSELLFASEEPPQKINGQSGTKKEHKLPKNKTRTYHRHKDTNTRDSSVDNFDTVL